MASDDGVTQSRCEACVSYNMTSTQCTLAYGHEGSHQSSYAGGFSESQANYPPLTPQTRERIRAEERKRVVQTLRGKANELGVGGDGPVAAYWFDRVATTIENGDNEHVLECCAKLRRRVIALETAARDVLENARDQGRDDCMDDLVDEQYIERLRMAVEGKPK